jgi:Tfp pilus assembly protein PilZ
MQLRLGSLKDFVSIWRDDFLGMQGFFLPEKRKFVMGESFSMDIRVQDEEWGSVEVALAWHNAHGMNTEQTPRGAFLALVHADGSFRKKLQSF